MSRLFDLTTTPIEDGITVVEASAGTGKTYCLVGLVLRLLLERRVNDVSELLVVTFTKAATQELVERLRDALTRTCRLLEGGGLAGEGENLDPFFRYLAETYRGDGKALSIAREALVRFDDLTVSTIHGFCLRVLGDSAFESGEPFDGELVENAASMLLEAARDVWRHLLYVTPKGGQRNIASARRPRDRALGIVATVVAEEGLTPESFLADVELSRRHPHTEILPPATDLEAATQRLRRAHEALRDGWDSAAVRMLLEPRRFLRGSYFAGALQDRLRGAEAFCASGEPSGLRAVLELAGDRLEAALFKRDRAGIARHPQVATCTAFAAAVAEFRHALRCRFVADVNRRFEADKRSSLIWTYDDLLRRLRRALDDPRRGRALIHAVRRRYRAALIDEFQDTDLIQYQIFHRLFRRGPLVLIGDPKQAIYRFRGADVFAYLAARDDADRVYTLAHNWRTERPLVEAVNAVFSHSASAGGRPFVFEQIAFEPAFAARRSGSVAPEGRKCDSHVAGDHRPLQWIWVPRLRTRELARSAIEDAVTGEIARLLDEATSPPRGANGTSPPRGADDLAPNDVAVLVRTNEQAASLQSALRAAGIPSVIGRSGNIFHSGEMADLETLLIAIADPGDGGRLRAAWATRLWGASDRDVRAANRDQEGRSGGAPTEDFARRFERFALFRHDWRRRGFMPMIQQLFAERGVRRRLRSSLAGERRLTNLTHATELLHRAERELHLSPAALLGWLAAERARERPETGSAVTSAALREDLELRLESDEAAVQIVTVHRSKGLEYEIVFCPYLWQARAADSEPVQAHIAPATGGSCMVLDYGSGELDRHRCQAEAERLSEEARLTYVALTRARRRCYVVWGDIAGKDGPADSALGYLLHRRAEGSAGPLTAADPGKLAEQALASVKAGREGWYRELGRLIAAHADVMELHSVDEVSLAPLRSDSAASAGRRAPGREPPGELRPRPFRGSIPRPWSLESFSSLSRAGHSNDAGREDHDVDDPSMPEALRPEPGGIPPDPLSSRREDKEIPPSPPFPKGGTGREASEPSSKGGTGMEVSESSSIVAFARGRRAGSCLHRVLELCDLARLDSAETGELIAESLRRFGLEEPQRHIAERQPGGGFDPAGAVREMLRRLAAAALPGAGVALGAVPRSGWLVEWKFTMPLGRVTPQRLARVFREHSQGTTGSDYPTRLEALGHTEVHGYLTGFVDTIFEHAGRWYLVDWKSNDLGPSTANYGAKGMWQAMSHHHYVLQYHLYLVALHRFLSRRIADYDYRHHVAGACYVFLRGLEPTQASMAAPTGQTGWYADRPTPALIKALDALIGGGR